MLPASNQISNRVDSNNQTNSIQNANVSTPQNTNGNTQTISQQKLINPNSNKVNITAEQLENLLREKYSEGTTGKSKKISGEAEQEIEDIKNNWKNLTKRH